MLFGLHTRGIADKHSSPCSLQRLSLSAPKQETESKSTPSIQFFWQCYGVLRYKTTKAKRTTLRLARLWGAKYKLSVALSIDVHGLLQI